MKSLSSVAAKALVCLMEGGTLIGRRLFPGPWHYHTEPRTIPGESVTPAMILGEPTVVSLATSGYVRAEFSDLGQNTHEMRYAITSAGRTALERYEA